jgi:transposase
LLHLGEVTAVTVPSVEQEAARDLVRARDDVRRDLSASRHRLSKLLLRQGVVYSGGKPWNGVHERWLRAQRRDLPALWQLPGLAAEIGDWQRLTGRSIGAYLGLVPSESSSGQSRSQGGITKTGNGHVRRLLIEAAWHHRAGYRPDRPSVELRRRQDRASVVARHRADQANRRLHARWVRFDARGKRLVVANTAIARELAGWCWSLAVLDD